MKQQAVTVARPGNLLGHRDRKASYARLASVLSQTEVFIATGWEVALVRMTAVSRATNCGSDSLPCPTSFAILT